MRCPIFLIFYLMISIVAAQDKLVFNNGEVVECKVVEITPEFIKYNKHSIPEGPLYTIYKREINSIVFENGEIELIRPISAYPGRTGRHFESGADHPGYRSTFGVDPLALAFREIRVWFEKRNANDRIGHTFTLTGFWDVYGYYYYDDWYGGYYYPYGGGLAFGYMPKIYFIKHPIVRPYFAPETSLGFNISDYSGGYFRGMARLGVALNPTPRFNMDFDISGGGYLVFDGYSNYGGGLLTVGLSFGMNYGVGRRHKE